MTHITEFHFVVNGVTDREADEIYRAVLDALYGQDVVESGFVHIDQVEVDHGEEESLQ